MGTALTERGVDRIRRRDRYYAALCFAARRTVGEHERYWQRVFGDRNRVAQTSSTSSSGDRGSAPWKVGSVRICPFDESVREGAKPGEDVIIPPAVSEEQAKQKFPGGWKTLKPYLRVVAQPK